MSAQPVQAFHAEDDTPTPLNSYKVWLRSVPGPYEQYDGFVRVMASDQAGAVEAALRQLRRTSFPDRPASMWRVEAIVLQL